jgi:acyl-CoA dehydrogenase
VVAAAGTRRTIMAIDFEIPEDAKAIRDKVRAFVHDECIPAEEQL